MGYADGALSLVDVLAARTGGTEGVYLKVSRIYLELDLIHLGQHRYRDRAGVYPAAGLGLRNALYPVDAGLVLEPRIGARALYDKADLLYPA